MNYSQLKALYKSITATPLSADGILEVSIQTAHNTVAGGCRHPGVGRQERTVPCHRNETFDPQLTRSRLRLIL